jgi:hypothetical protein
VFERPKEEYTSAEAALLEAETEVVKTRLQQSKSVLGPGVFSELNFCRLASQSLSRAIKSIAQEIERTDNDILAAQERLSELSLKVGTEFCFAISC